MIRVHIFIATLITILHPIICSRKYDIEKESLKLYGENLQTVLKKFRRTPDYLKILKDKLDDLEQQSSDVSLQIVHYYSSKVQSRVKEILGATENLTIGMTLGEEISTTALPRRQEEGEGNPDKDTDREERLDHEAVRRLDMYEKLNSALTTAERNNFKDLGFEFAGTIIHGIIKHFGSDTPDNTDAAGLSTKGMVMGEQGLEVTTTTEHVKVHQVTTPPPTTEIETRVTNLESSTVVRARHRALRALQRSG